MNTPDEKNCLIKLTLHQNRYHQVEWVNYDISMIPLRYYFTF